MKKIVVVLIAFICYGCTADFLDISNPGRLSPSLFPKSMEDMEQVVTSMYGQMSQVGLYGKRIFAKGTFCTDHTVDMSWTADANWNQMTTNQLVSDNTYVTTLWYAHYKLISCANTALEAIESINRDKFSEADIKRLSQMKGEALFWRAFAHQQLVALFGEGFPCNGDGEKQGIPIRTEVASSPSLLNISRSSVNDVYKQILSDYNEAEKLLPQSWTDPHDYPRPTSIAVKSYIGQLNLFMGDKEAAKTALKAVIDNSGKQLLGFDDYARLFNEKQIKFSKESILEINFRNGNSGANFWNSEGSQYALVAALCFKNKNGDVEAAGWGNIFFHDANIKRFGSDPRLHLTALKPGTPVVMRGLDTEVIKYKDIEDSYQGWSLRKYIPMDARVGDAPYVANSVGINMFLMRLADVYLMYAEACLGNDDATAREFVNKVRRRAYNLPVDSPSDIDLQSSGDQLKTDLQEERFKEFCGEGVQHWIDVCRWKTLEQEIRTWYSNTRVGQPHYDANDLYYPIPKTELENNPNMKQSLGYENN